MSAALPQGKKPGTHGRSGRNGKKEKNCSCLVIVALSLSELKRRALAETVWVRRVKMGSGLQLSQK